MFLRVLHIEILILPGEEGFHKDEAVYLAFRGFIGQPVETMEAKQITGLIIKLTNNRGG